MYVLLRERISQYLYSFNKFIVTRTKLLAADVVLTRWHKLYNDLTRNTTGMQPVPVNVDEIEKITIEFYNWNARDSIVTTINNVAKINTICHFAEFYVLFKRIQTHVRTTNPLMFPSVFKKVCNSELRTCLPKSRFTDMPEDQIQAHIRGLRHNAEKCFAVLVTRGIDDLGRVQKLRMNDIKAIPPNEISRIIEMYNEAEMRGELDTTSNNPYEFKQPLINDSGDNSGACSGAGTIKSDVSNVGEEDDEDAQSDEKENEEGEVESRREISSDDGDEEKDKNCVVEKMDEEEGDTAGDKDGTSKLGDDTTIAKNEDNVVAIDDNAMGVDKDDTTETKDDTTVNDDTPKDLVRDVFIGPADEGLQHASTFVLRKR